MNDEMKFFTMSDELKEEPILEKNSSRFVLFPINYPQIWEFYKKSVASFWTVEEIDLSKDRHDWEIRLNDDERHFLSRVLGFFTFADGIVGENLVERFSSEIAAPEARCFYGFQIMMENIHSEMYSLLLDTFIQDFNEKRKLMNSIENVPSIKAKATWSLKWLESQLPFSIRIIAFAIIEGVFFSSSFASIYWVKRRGILNGLTFSNELIARDEGMHCDFACMIYRHLKNKAYAEDVYNIFREAVYIEQLFVKDALSGNVIGLSASMMCSYVEYVADRLLVELGYKKLWNTKNPLDFMELISLQGKTNFFEKRVGEYQKSGVVNKNDFVFATDQEF